MKYKDKIKEKGLIITWIAKQIGINRSLLSMYINEVRPMPEEVEKKLKEILL